MEPVTAALGAVAISLNAYGAFQYWRSRRALEPGQAAQQKAQDPRTGAIKAAVELDAGTGDSATQARPKASREELIAAIDAATRKGNGGDGATAAQTQQPAAAQMKPIFPGNPTPVQPGEFERIFKEIRESKNAAMQNNAKGQPGPGDGLFDNDGDEDEEDGEEEDDVEEEGAQSAGAHKEILAAEIAPLKKNISDLEKKVQKLEEALEKARKPAKKK
ncbi:MAG: hypothetical protein WC792_00440 [Candidatus Micrarchaeia archaeon]|jgi:hypothetical protein